jgi:glycosyltransferase involved in cell wall biosynthesis
MKDRIIYISPDEATFTRRDINFLSKNYEVITIKQPWGIKSRIPGNLVRQFFFLIKHLPGSKAVFIMFGGYWSFLPALLGKLIHKPVFIIPGGADCVSFPEYNYGSLRKPLMRRIIKWSYTLAERILPVSETLVKVDYSYDPGVKATKQGYMNFFPGLRTPYSVIYNGFDADFWQMQGETKDNSHVTTIATVTDHTRFKVKGIDLVIDIAMQFPEHFFHIVGMSDQFRKTLGELPGNVIIHGYMSSEELRDLLSKSRFYLQLSISEGFPNALCEAMLCECIPVGSAVGAIPFIIGESGALLEHKNPELATGLISRLIAMSPEELNDQGKKARNNIVNRFPLDTREKAISELILTYRK